MIQRSFKPIYKKITSDSYNLLLVLIILLIVFVSDNGYVLTPFAENLYNIFFNGLVGGKFFSIFEVLVLVYCIRLFNEFSFDFAQRPLILKLIMVFAFLCYLLRLFNPNNKSSNPILGLPLLSEINQYVYLVVLIIFFFVEDSAYYFTINKILKLAFFLFVARTVVLFFLWTLGYGYTFFYSVPSVLLETDTLYYIALIQTLLLVLFLTDHNRKYLIAYLFFSLFLVLSFRRSALIVAFLTNILIYSIHFLFIRKKSQKLILLLIFSVFIFISALLYGTVLGNNSELYIKRFSGLLSAENQPDYASDSGHFLQSYLTINDAMLQNVFWGKGYGQIASLEGEYIVIHNIYAAAWAQYGIFQMIYYLFIGISSLLMFSILLFSKVKYELKTWLIKLNASIFLTLFMINAFFLPLIYVTRTKMALLSFILLSLMFRYEESDLSFFRGKK